MNMDEPSSEPELSQPIEMSQPIEELSQVEESLPVSPVSPTRMSAATEILELIRPRALDFVAVDALVNLQDPINEEEEKEYKEDDDEKDFLSLAPGNNDDNVFSVGAESQFLQDSKLSTSQLNKQLHFLIPLMNSLKETINRNSPDFFQKLQNLMKRYLEEPDIRVYGNHLIVTRFGQSMLVPMLSFYGIAKKDIIAHVIKPNMHTISDDIRNITSEFLEPAGFPVSNIDCTMPTASNMVWNVRLTLNGNIFTLLTFRIVTMKRNVFHPQQPEPILSLQNEQLLLCFSLLSKASAKDFNCLCAMPDIDVALFKTIIEKPNTQEIINAFLELLDEPQNESKKKYIITALYNLIANVVDSTRTGETLAYQYLFDTPNPASNTFNTIMREIKKNIQLLRPTGTELQVSLCGGRMIYKLGEILRGHVTSKLSETDASVLGIPLQEMVKPLNIPSDADFTIAFSGLNDTNPDVIQTYSMFYTLCLQLCIKKILDTFCTTSPEYSELFLKF